MAKTFKLTKEEWEDLRFAVESDNKALTLHFMDEIESRSVFKLIPRVNSMWGKWGKVSND